LLSCEHQPIVYCYKTRLAYDDQQKNGDKHELGLALAIKERKNFNSLEEVG
jgi:hypothetical protein